MSSHSVQMDDGAATRQRQPEREGRPQNGAPATPRDSGAQQLQAPPAQARGGAKQGLSDRQRRWALDIRRGADDEEEEDDREEDEEDSEGSSSEEAGGKTGRRRVRFCSNLEQGATGTGRRSSKPSKHKPKGILKNSGGGYALDDMSIASSRSVSSQRARPGMKGSSAYALDDMSVPRKGRGGEGKKEGLRRVSAGTVAETPRPSSGRKKVTMFDDSSQQEGRTTKGNGGGSGMRPARGSKDDGSLLVRQPTGIRPKGQGQRLVRDDSDISERRAVGFGFTNDDDSVRGGRGKPAPSSSAFARQPTGIRPKGQGQRLARDDSDISERRASVGFTDDDDSARGTRGKPGPPSSAFVRQPTGIRPKGQGQRLAVDDSDISERRASVGFTDDDDSVRGGRGKSGPPSSAFVRQPTGIRPRDLKQAQMGVDDWGESTEGRTDGRTEGWISSDEESSRGKGKASFGPGGKAARFSLDESSVLVRQPTGAKPKELGDARGSREDPRGASGGAGAGSGTPGAGGGAAGGKPSIPSGLASSTPKGQGPRRTAVAFDDGDVWDRKGPGAASMKGRASTLDDTWAVDRREAGARSMKDMRALAAELRKDGPLSGPAKAAPGASGLAKEAQSLGQRGKEGKAVRAGFCDDGVLDTKEGKPVRVGFCDDGVLDRRGAGTASMKGRGATLDDMGVLDRDRGEAGARSMKDMKALAAELRGEAQSNKPRARAPAGPAGVKGRDFRPSKDGFASDDLVVTGKQGQRKAMERARAEGEGLPPFVAKGPQGMAPTNGPRQRSPRRAGVNPWQATAAEGAYDLWGGSSEAAAPVPAQAQPSPSMRSPRRQPPQPGHLGNPQPGHLGSPESGHLGTPQVPSQLVRAPGESPGQKPLAGEAGLSLTPLVMLSPDLLPPSVPSQPSSVSNQAAESSVAVPWSPAMRPQALQVVASSEDLSSAGPALLSPASSSLRGPAPISPALLSPVRGSARAPANPESPALALVTPQPGPFSPEALNRAKKLEHELQRKDCKGAEHQGATASPGEGAGVGNGAELGLPTSGKGLEEEEEDDDDEGVVLEAEEVAHWEGQGREDDGPVLEAEAIHHHGMEHHYNMGHQHDLDPVPGFDEARDRPGTGLVSPHLQRQPPESIRLEGRIMSQSQALGPGPGPGPSGGAPRMPGVSASEGFAAGPVPPRPVLRVRRGSWDDVGGLVVAGGGGGLSSQKVQEQAGQVTATPGSNSTVSGELPRLGRSVAKDDGEDVLRSRKVSYGPVGREASSGPEGREALSGPVSSAPREVPFPKPLPPGMVPKSWSGERGGASKERIPLSSKDSSTEVDSGRLQQAPSSRVVPVGSSKPRAKAADFESVDFGRSRTSQRGEVRRVARDDGEMMDFGRSQTASRQGTKAGHTGKGKEGVGPIPGAKVERVGRLERVERVELGGGQQQLGSERPRSGPMQGSKVAGSGAVPRRASGPEIQGEDKQRPGADKQRVVQAALAMMGDMKAFVLGAEEESSEDEGQPKGKQKSRTPRGGEEVGRSFKNGSRGEGNGEHKGSIRTPRGREEVGRGFKAPPDKAASEPASVPKTEEGSKGFRAPPDKAAGVPKMFSGGRSKGVSDDEVSGARGGVPRAADDSAVRRYVSDERGDRGPQRPRSSADDLSIRRPSAGSVRASQDGRRGEARASDGDVRASGSMPGVVRISSDGKGKKAVDGSGGGGEGKAAMPSVVRVSSDGKPRRVGVVAEADSAAGKKGKKPASDDSAVGRVTRILAGSKK